MYCATPHTFLSNWTHSGGEKFRVQSYRITLLALFEVHQKAGDVVPALSFGFLKMVTVRGGVGPQSPTGCARFPAARKSNRIGAGLLQRPTLAAGPGFIQ